MDDMVGDYNVLEGTSLTCPQQHVSHYLLHLNIETQKDLTLKPVYLYDWSHKK